jgi:hypothetical protein
LDWDLVLGNDFEDLEEHGVTVFLASRVCGENRGKIPVKQYAI